MRAIGNKHCLELAKCSSVNAPAVLEEKDNSILGFQNGKEGGREC